MFCLSQLLLKLNMQCNLNIPTTWQQISILLPKLCHSIRVSEENSIFPIAGIIWFYRESGVWHNGQKMFVEKILHFPYAHTFFVNTFSVIILLILLMKNTYTFNICHFNTLSLHLLQISSKCLYHNTGKSFFLV